MKTPLFPHNPATIKGFPFYHVLVGLGKKWAKMERRGHKNGHKKGIKKKGGGFRAALLSFFPDRWFRLIGTSLPDSKKGVSGAGQGKKCPFFVFPVEKTSILTSASRNVHFELFSIYAIV